MPYRTTLFANDGYYHVYNRGVEKRTIFLDDSDYQRFLKTLYYYQFSELKFRFSLRNSPLNEDYEQKLKMVEVACYCLMPNHFHLVVRQLKDGGVQKLMQRISNSYTKYLNTRNSRVGSLFQGAFKAVPIETDEQLIHVSRYIHLNPYVSGVTQDLNTYPYSSYFSFISRSNDLICNTQPVLSLFKDTQDYKEFVVGHGDYARELEIMKHLLLDEE